MADNHWNQDVTAYIHNIHEDWQIDVCQQIRTIIHQSVPELKEQIKMTTPNYSKNGKAVCTFFAAKKWVTWTIFYAGSLDIPESLRNESDYPDRLQLKIKKGQTLDEHVLTRFLQQAASSL